MKQVLQEFTNKDIIKAGIVDTEDWSSLNAVRADFDQVTTEVGLQDYAMQCQGAFLRILRDSNVLLTKDGSEPAHIDITRGGGDMLFNIPQGEELTRFSSRKVFNFTIFPEAGPIVRMYEILSGAAQLVDEAGNPATQVLADLRTVANYYRRAFERILLPERVANRQEAEIERFKADLNAENVVAVNPEITGYWSILGWLTKNVRQIKAKIPERGDFLDVFLAHNREAKEGEGYEIHADGLTSGGFTNQFTYMFLISFTNRVKIPTAVENWLKDFGSQVKNPMSCTKLAMLLINRYGFRFGLTDRAAVAKTCLSYTRSDKEIVDFFNGYGEGADELAAEIGYTIPAENTDDLADEAFSQEYPEVSVEVESDYGADYEFPEV